MEKGWKARMRGSLYALLRHVSQEKIAYHSLFLFTICLTEDHLYRVTDVRTCRKQKPQYQYTVLPTNQDVYHFLGEEAARDANWELF
ncbi:hypothetical protein KDK_24260 [Dictyobacter kobayashii]|uniref:Uncharacterized protein n=1 Tax=Dictyobacter kobayashii TaxID=2014872 RepID=A0A402AHP5_9CHLR|nr:hypothetical protein KDK_24260 [Dictyobacter kobayashii]